MKICISCGSAHIKTLVFFKWAYVKFIFLREAGQLFAGQLSFCTHGGSLTFRKREGITEGGHFSKNHECLYRISYQPRDDEMIITKEK